MRSSPSLHVLAVIGLMLSITALDAASPVYAHEHETTDSIVFHSDRDGDFDIWAVAPGGGSPAQVADLPGADTTPRWSPDGTKIAFVVDGGNTTAGRLWIMNADGTGATQVNSIQTRFAPAWSPDGTEIAFMGNSGDGDFDIHVIGADGSNQRKVVDTPENETDPTWTSEGIAVEQADSILIFDATTGDLVFEQEVGFINHLSASPDGREIAFSQLLPDSFQRISVLNIATGSIVGVTDGTAYDASPGWSPDGNQIVFSRRPSFSEGVFDIYVIDVNGSNTLQLTSSTHVDIGADWRPTQTPPALIEINISEEIGVADGLLLDSQTPVEISITEQVEVGDDVQVGPPVVVQIGIAEKIGVGDRVEVTSPIHISITEEVGVIDRTVVNPPVLIEVSQDVGVRDDVTVILAAIVDVETTDAIPGQDVEFSGDGFDPGSGIDIGIESDFCLLDTITADSQGGFSVVVTIPSPEDCPDGLAAGSHTLVAAGVDPNGQAYEVRASLTIRAPVEVNLSSSNPTTASVDTTFTLSAIFADVSGDLTDEVLDPADATIVLEPVGPGSTVDPHTCSTETVDNDVYRVECDFSDVLVNTYAVVASIDAGVFVGSDEAVLTVSDPSLGFTTGGGWFDWPNTDEHTNFGFSVTHNRKGSNVKGNLLVIRKLADGTRYEIKSNAIHGLAVGSDHDPSWATFSGKATYLSPEMSEPEGNHSFVVYAEDHSGGDRFWLEVRDKDGVLIDAMTMPSPASTNSVELLGGNIVIPHEKRGGPR